ncbi:MAG: hypothetical protein AB8B54_10430 [Sphingorhabdus sp.]
MKNSGFQAFYRRLHMGGYKASHVSAFIMASLCRTETASGKSQERMAKMVNRDIGSTMEKYRDTIGWGAIIIAALSFLPIPLPALPPMLSSSMFMLLPGLGSVMMMIVPMLLFAAGIGLVKGWDGGRKLFVIWAALSGLAALGGFQYSPNDSIVDLVIIAACLVVVLWGDWRQLLPPPRR